MDFSFGCFVFDNFSYRYSLNQLDTHFARQFFSTCILLEPTNKLVNVGGIFLVFSKDSFAFGYPRA